MEDTTDAKRLSVSRLTSRSAPAKRCTAETPAMRDGATLNWSTSLCSTSLSRLSAESSHNTAWSRLVQPLSSTATPRQLRTVTAHEREPLRGRELRRLRRLRRHLGPPRPFPPGALLVVGRGRLGEPPPLPPRLPPAGRHVTLWKVCAISGPRALPSGCAPLLEPTSRLGQVEPQGLQSTPRGETRAAASRQTGASCTHEPRVTDWLTRRFHSRT